MPFRLVVPRALYEAMVGQALAEQPLECCGLLAGVIDAKSSVGQVVKAYPLVNALASPVEYESEPRSIIAAYRDMSISGLELLAVYHSHPTSAPLPSRKDIDRNWAVRDFLGDVVHLIVSLAQSPPLVRAWWLGENDYREAEWQVV
jgi:proteasome lid subunit RPN8/RPN11